MLDICWSTRAYLHTSLIVSLQMPELRWRTALKFSVCITRRDVSLLSPAVVLLLESLLVDGSVDSKVPLLLAYWLLLQVAALTVQPASDLVGVVAWVKALYHPQF